MADEVAEKESTQGSLGSDAGGLVPKNVPTGVRAAIGKMALDVVLAGFQKIMDALDFNIREKQHLPSLKLLTELAMLVTEVEDVRLVDYVGFAEQLKKKMVELQGEVLEGVVMLPDTAVDAEDSDSGVGE